MAQRVNMTARVNQYCFILAFLMFLQINTAPAAEKSLKVFILAGQSNMQGHGVVPANPQRNEGKGSLEYAASHSRNKEIKNWLQADGTWVTRDDVWIHYMERHGKLSPTFGVRAVDLKQQQRAGLAATSARTSRYEVSSRIALSRAPFC